LLISRHASLSFSGRVLRSIRPDIADQVAPLACAGSDERFLPSRFDGKSLQFLLAMP